MFTKVFNVTLSIPSSTRMILTSTAAAEPRVEVMFIIFFASLLAASFPTLSTQIPILRIPTAVFLIGKHFGTGVILATAFVHLLDDAFRSLQNPLVQTRYGNIGKWTGPMILGSLLVIFLVEYISTSYVDYLQSKPSAPPTPISSAQPSRPASLSRPILYQSLPRSNISKKPQPTISTDAEIAPPMSITQPPFPTETAPLLAPAQFTTNTPLSLSRRHPRRQLSEPHLLRTNLLHSSGHSPHDHRYHNVHHIYSPIIPPAAVTGVPIDILTNSPRIFRQLGLGHSHSHEHVEPEQTNEENLNHIHYHDHVHENRLQIHRRRQVVGILVLQLGIMIHSLVIGLTLAVTNGSDFTSLTTAILFHQLFEGLSLGIRIASLPPKHIEIPIAVEDDEGLVSAPPAPSLLPRTYYIPPDIDADQHAPSNSPPLPGTGTEVQPRRNFWTSRDREVQWLKPTLSFLFALTTPFGMGMGMILLRERLGSDTIQMSLIQGTMSAISAGMLIYAGTVEMIAGDFVFGDVDGGHGHGHGHGHVHHHDIHPQGSGGSRSHSHPENHDMPGQSRGDYDDGKQDKDVQSKTTASMAKKILAVLSLLAGATCMVLLGLSE